MAHVAVPSPRSGLYSSAPLRRCTVGRRGSLKGLKTCLRRKVYSDTFLEKLNAFEDFKEDCFHPRSPLIDCIAAVLLCKMRLGSKLLLHF